MNLTIETLNLWGARALAFAWPALWQSSLLIGLLVALDFVLRRQVRAAVRYALWLVVLLKLLLPPALALPTGVAWWLRPAKATPVAPPAVAFTVTEGPAVAPTMPEPVVPVSVVAAPTRPALSLAAWALMVSSGVSLGLLAWMLLRWRQVARDVQQAGAAPQVLRDLLDEARQCVGLRQPVQLGLMEQPRSPAVCGLFRPRILLPRSLAEQLPPSQLRAILVHELIHLRRGDVWVNCVQALLQLLYWWHPLLWLANARIRQVREEAVDDAVMAALREEAEAYAPTLLEVARLALQRPLTSLGLVGILESRSSLRQRIQRLLEFHPPRKAGLTLASALVILAFAAMAVPMGEAPAPREATQPAASAGGTTLPSSEWLKGTNVSGATGAPAVALSANATVPVAASNTPLQQLQFLDPSTIRFSPPITNQYALTSITSNTVIQQTVPRVVTQPDMLFTTQALGFPWYPGMTNASGAPNAPGATTAIRWVAGPSILTNSSPATHASAQIHIQTRFLELPEAEAVAFCKRFSVTNAPGSNIWSTTLTPAQAAEERTQWKSDANVKVLASPEIVVFSGRRCQMKCVDVKTVITDFTNTAQPGFPQCWAPQSKTVELGPILDCTPALQADGCTIQLAPKFALDEFLGYEDPRYKPKPPGGQPAVWPELRHREFAASSAVRDGQTVVLGGLVSEEVAALKDKVPVLGDIPLVGKLFRSESRSTKKVHLFILITPRLVTPEGKPVHPTDEFSDQESLLELARQQSLLNAKTPAAKQP